MGRETKDNMEPSLLSNLSQYQMISLVFFVFGKIVGVFSIMTLMLYFNDQDYFGFTLTAIVLYSCFILLSIVFSFLDYISNRAKLNNVLDKILDDPEYRIEVLRKIRETS